MSIEDTAAADNGTDSCNATDLEKRIVNQIEYYFGDYNLPRDKFLRYQVKLDDGWVPLQVLVTFNRLKKLSEDQNVIAEALKKLSKLIEVNDDNSKVRRKVEKPLPEFTSESKQKIEECSVYAKGFPKNSTLDEILEFFQGFGSIVSVYLRKIPKTKDFKGSVFATFSTKEEAEAFVSKEQAKFKNIELIRLMRKDYGIKKHEEYKQRKEQRKLAKEKSKKDVDSDDEDDDEDDEMVQEGSLLKLTNLPSEMTREIIKDTFSPHAPVAFVEYNKGEEEAIVRFQLEGCAEAALSKAMTGEGEDKKLIIGGHTVIGSVVEGDEESAYWKRYSKYRKEMRQRNKNKGRGRQGGGRFGRKGKRTSGDGPSYKQAKVEAKEEVQEKSSEDDSPVKIKSEESAGEVEKDGDQKPSKKHSLDEDGTSETPQEKRIKVDDVKEEA